MKTVLNFRGRPIIFTGPPIFNKMCLTGSHFQFSLQSFQYSLDNLTTVVCYTISQEELLISVLYRTDREH